jgi:hypothetical protein
LDFEQEMKMQKHNAMLTPLILLSDTHDEAKKEVEGGAHGKLG